MRVQSVSVVVPVYNSEQSLPTLLERLVPILLGLGVPWEVVFVYDGSPDRSWEVVCEMARQYPNVRGIALSRNFGQHNALLCGIRAARHEVVVTMDDDLQHPPEEMPLLLRKLEEGFDVVYGTPHRQQHGSWRDASSVLTKLALRHILGAATARDVSAFRAFRTALRDAFAEYRSPFVSIDGLLSWGARHFGAVSVRHDSRRLGRSNYNLRKLFQHAANLTTGFSTAPLQLASLLGFAATLFGLFVLAVVVARYLFAGGGTVPGFSFLASIITIFAGAQLFSLGIIGEYLARMYFRTLDKPVYLVQEERGGLSEQPQRSAA